LNSTAPVPSHETIRGWMQRVGLGRVRLAKKADGGTWIVDHTNQIGPEKVLTVLRVGSAPSDGDALRHQDVEVLATIPGTKSKREDVAREYEQIAATFGRPDNVVTDGAVELRESVQVLEKAGNTPRIFRDPKHFLANKRSRNRSAQRVRRCSRPNWLTSRHHRSKRRRAS
jgi:hypothetical protein